jgi:drug/metabolite transporter (DMT)-like permease
MNDNQKKLGHVLAVFTIFVWGVTFISSKILLRAFSPEEIIVLRFLFGYVILWLLHPKKPEFYGWKQEAFIAMAGLFGITLYYLCENTALTYTYASNVGILVSAAPFMTVCAIAILFREPVSRSFMAGLVIAMVGVILVNFNGSEVLHMNPLGGWFALLAAACWTGYSVVMRLLNELEMDTIVLTRRIFFYGLILLIPYLITKGVSISVSDLCRPVYLLNICFLGIAASAVCYLTWNRSMELIGTVKSSVYINLQPVIATAFSALILEEKITPIALIGMVLIVGGLFLSEYVKPDRTQK